MANSILLSSVFLPHTEFEAGRLERLPYPGLDNFVRYKGVFSLETRRRGDERFAAVLPLLICARIGGSDVPGLRISFLKNEHHQPGAKPGDNSQVITGLTMFNNYLTDPGNTLLFTDPSKGSEQFRARLGFLLPLKDSSPPNLPPNQS